MDDRRFDELAKRLGTGSRRGFLKGLFGMASIAVAGRGLASDAEAARRGYSGPPPRPTPPPPVHYCTPDGTCCVECTPFGLQRFQNCLSNGSICTDPNETCCQACADWSSGCNVTSN